jgi:hypothetical protein
VSAAAQEPQHVAARGLPEERIEVTRK